MKLYLMRHGETDYNQKGLIQGRLDVPLNQNGIHLAELTRDGFRKEGWSLTSPTAVRWYAPERPRKFCWRERIRRLFTTTVSVR